LSNKPPFGFSPAQHAPENFAPTPPAASGDKAQTDFQTVVEGEVLGRWDWPGFHCGRCSFDSRVETCRESLGRLVAANRAGLGGRVPGPGGPLHPSPVAGERGVFVKTMAWVIYYCESERCSWAIEAQGDASIKRLAFLGLFSCGLHAFSANHAKPSIGIRFCLPHHWRGTMHGRLARPHHIFNLLGSSSPGKKLKGRSRGCRDHRGKAFLAKVF